MMPVFITVSDLLEKGVDPCVTDSKKRTALHIAASKGHHQTGSLSVLISGSKISLVANGRRSSVDGWTGVFAAFLIVNSGERDQKLLVFRCNAYLIFRPQIRFVFQIWLQLTIIYEVR